MTPTTPPADDWQQTFSGIVFRPLKPRAHDVRAADIAHALSLQTRYGGHSLVPHSVAAHSLLVVEILRVIGEEPRVQLAGLLHDAAEAYCIDLPSPLKRTPDLAGYRLIERAIEEAVAQRFGLDGRFFGWAEVKYADALALRLESEVLFASKPRPWATDALDVPGRVRDLWEGYRLAVAYGPSWHVVRRHFASTWLLLADKAGHPLDDVDRTGLAAFT